VANWALLIFEHKYFLAHRDLFNAGGIGPNGKPGALVMGTGPWIPVHQDPLSGVEYKANPHYWGGRVPIAHISDKIFKDVQSEALAFRGGDLDVAFLSFTGGSPQAFATTSGAKIHAYPDCGMGLFTMNTLVAPWSDVHVRRAVAYALNGAAIAKANGGFASMNYTFLPTFLLESLGTPAQVKAALGSVPIYKYDVARAKAELAKSAYPHGFSTELPVLAQWSLPSQVVAAELGQIGINAQLKGETDSAFWGGLTGPTQKRSAAFVEFGCSSPDPSVYNWALGSANAVDGLWNLSDWGPPDVDGLITQSVATSNPAKRLATYANCCSGWARTSPMFRSSRTTRWSPSPVASAGRATTASSQGALPGRWGSS
jgi:peptide/nickel transport system substrate-binding protein